MRGKQQDARWTFWFSTVKDLGRDCPGRSEIDKGKGAIQHPAGFQRTLREVLLKDNKTKLVKLLFLFRGRL